MAAEQSLLDDLLAAGLLHFGYFERDGRGQPFASALDLLGSYPALLGRLTALGAAAVQGTAVNRLVAAPDAIPFGTALSLALDVPLVYSQGAGREAAFDLVGAYDIGHPALLVTLTWGKGVDWLSLIKTARRVGLDVRTVLTVLDCGASTTDVTVISLLRLDQVVSRLQAMGWLPVGQADAVREWVAEPDYPPGRVASTR